MGVKQSYALLTNIGAVGNGNAVVIGGGTYSWSVAGTFGGTAAKLQLLGPDGTTWIDIPSATLSAAGVMSVDVAGGASIRAVLTGGTPSGIYSSLAFIR